MSGPDEAPRRSFLRHAVGRAIEASEAAARMAGSGARPLIAAGEAVADELRGPTADPEAEEKAGTVEADGVADAPAAPAEAQAPATPEPARPTDEQRAILEHAAQGVLGTLDHGAPDREPTPRLTVARLRWDGAHVLVAARTGTARVNDLHRSPRVTLLVDDPAGGRTLSVAGSARLQYDQADPASGAVTVEVTPERFLLAPKPTVDPPEPAR